MILRNRLKKFPFLRPAPAAELLTDRALLFLVVAFFAIKNHSKIIFSLAPGQTAGTASATAAVTVVAVLPRFGFISGFSYFNGFSPGVFFCNKL